MTDREPDASAHPAGADVSADAEAPEDRISRLERELDLTREMLRQATARSTAQANDLARARSELGRIRNRRSVKLALAISSRLRGLIGGARNAAHVPRQLVRRARSKLRRMIWQRSLRASAADESALADAVRAGLSPAVVTSGPLVSIVILNRNGLDHLTRCLAALDRTAYRPFDVVVVDNGSTDGSAEYAESTRFSYPVRVVRNQENRSFSEGNDQGVAASRGELICLLNNDVDPITEHWLGYLVETTLAFGAAAVGARLIYPRHRGGARGGATSGDLTLQHAGVTFDRSGPMPMPRVIGAGEDPLGPQAVEVGDRVALTAACLLVRRDALKRVGGFTVGYDYGIEDVDLCLKLQAAGYRLVYDGRAALWHHESATRAADRQRYGERVAKNRELFVDLWGPRLYRQALVEALTGVHHLSDQPFHVAIAITSHDKSAAFGDWYTGHELGDALAALGWRVSYVQRAGDEWYRPDPSAEAMIVLLDALDVRRLPRSLITIAWIRNWAERWVGQPWFDDYDLVFASSQAIVDLVRRETSKVAALLPLATNPARFKPTEADPERACDVVFVGSNWGQDRGVVEALPALAERGFDVRVHGRGWSDQPGFARLDHGYLDYDSIPAAYASARVVIDDAAISTHASGSVNSRVFDALATGSIVLTNGTFGAEALFGPGFPTWTDADSLVAAVERILIDPREASERAEHDREVVLKEHTYARRAETIREALLGWATATRYGLRIGVSAWSNREHWGDYHFARGLQRALERSGTPTRLHLYPDWPDWVGAREDVAIHLFGLKEAPTRRSQVNLLWQISHPELANAELYDRYDHAFVGSDSFAARMASVCRVDVTPLHQATDPERFRPDPTGPAHQLLFVGSSRKVHRRIIDDLAGTEFELAVYGRDWTRDLIDPRYVVGESVPNRELHRYYSAAAIVLNDHWDDMRAEGFLSNRLYDASACAAFVISDQVPGIDTEFDHGVVTYTSRQHLLDLIARYLEDPEERTRLAERARAAVLERHTFEMRMEAIQAIAAPLLAARRPTVRA